MAMASWQKYRVPFAGIEEFAALALLSEEFGAILPRGIRPARAQVHGVRHTVNSCVFMPDRQPNTLRQAERCERFLKGLRSSGVTEIVIIANDGRTAELSNAFTASWTLSNRPNTNRSFANQQ
jgi:hypothetical protein